MSRSNPAPMTKVRGETGIIWRGIEQMANDINRRGNTLNRTRRLAVERLASRMQQYAQENAPWEDRTGNAREGIKAVAVHDEDKQTSTAYISHGVEYGLWLELQRGGEYAIIGPTIQHFEAQVMGIVREVDSFGGILNQMFGSFDE